MQTIRFPTEGNRFEDYRDAGHLFRVPFEVVQPNGHTRLPKPPMISPTSALTSAASASSSTTSWPTWSRTAISAPRLDRGPAAASLSR